MHIQLALPQPFIFPFSIRPSDEDLFAEERNRQIPVPTQEFLVLEPQTVEPRLKENLKLETRLKENLSLSPEAISIVRENGKRRFDEFKRYPKGWFGGKGSKISKYSVAVFESFIRKIPELKQYHPSLFLTLDGNISLGFEDKRHNRIEIEFYPDKVEYFVESLNEDASMGLVGIFELAEKIRKLLY